MFVKPVSSMKIVRILFKFYLTNLFTRLKSNVLIHDIFFYATSFLNQDDGILFESNVEYTNMRYNRRVSNLISISLIKDTSQINSLNNIFYSFHIYNDENCGFYNRRYMKLQDLFANVNSFIELLIFIVKFLYSIYSQFRFDYFLYTRLVRNFKDGKILYNNNSFHLNNKFIVSINNKKASHNQENIGINNQDEKLIDQKSKREI